MSRVIIDLAAKRQSASSSGPLEHPTGVTLPFDSPSDAALIIPEIRGEIRSGSYSADVLRLLPEAVRFGDRALIIGAGLGVATTLIARSEGIDRIIAIEANTSLVPYLNRVHALNNVSEIETVNAVLADGKKGRVPFFARRDLRTSSLVPHDRSWQQVMMVPFMDLNLILQEEQISLIVCDIPIASAQLLARAELGSVERILVGCGEDTDQAWEEDGVCKLLEARGYTAKTEGAAVLFERAGASDQTRPARIELAEDDEESGEGGDGTLDLTHDARLEFTGGELSASKPVPLDDEPETEEAPSVPDESQSTEDRPEEPDQAGSDMAGPGRTGSDRAGSGARAPSRRRRRRGRQAEARRASEKDGGRSGRLWWLVALSLFMALPLILIGELADNRAERRVAVEQEVGATWGGAQTLTGPFIVIPVETGGERFRTEPLVLLPEILTVDSELNTELRQRGVFEVPVYRGRHEIWLDIDPTLVAGGRVAGLLSEDDVVLWHEATLGLGIAEPHALRGRLMLDDGVGGGSGPVGFESGAFDPAAFGSTSGPVSTDASMAGVHARIGDPRSHVGGWKFTLELDGSQQFRLTPAGGITEGRLSSNWPHPRFSGAFLPERRVVGEAGFEAEWSIPQLAHSLPQAFRGTAQLRELKGADFGVDLLQPMDIYQTAQRAAQYGLLLIAMTFGAIFLMERLAPRRPHMMQYALIGAAQCVFFALLVSLAEQVGFNLAYGLATAATIVLLTIYAWFALRLGSRSGWLTMALGLLYGVVYLVLISEGQALLMGAVLAFLAVAGVMWGTRNEDWSAAFSALKPKQPRPESPSA